MKKISVYSDDFAKYGQVLDGYDFTELCEVMKKLPQPKDTFVYKASEEALESLKVFGELKNRAFGGMEMQLGYCNGRNDTLNCLEYHKCSELCICACDTILFLGFEGDIKNGKYDTAAAKAFFVPAGTGVELYATTLHYCPCHVKESDGFLVANGLLKGTNENMPEITRQTAEDKFLAGKNKWLLCHKESNEFKNGGAEGLLGKNYTTKDIDE